MDAAGIAALCVCSFAGSFVTAVSGIGGALIFQAIFYAFAAFVPLGSLKVAVAYSTFRSATSSPLVLWNSRRRVEGAMLKPMIPTLLVGTPIGTLLVQTMDIDSVARALGGLCLFVVGDLLAWPSKLAARLDALCIVAGPRQAAQATPKQVIGLRAGSH